MTRNKYVWLVIAIVLIGVAPTGMANLVGLGGGAVVGWGHSLGTFVNHLGK
jgi:hypothetical protein